MAFCSRWLCAAALALLVTACDDAPGPPPVNPRPPIVFDFQYSPDTVDVAEVPAEQVMEGQVTVDVSLSARAEDPDGTVERVLFLLEPASAPESQAVGELPEESGNRYGGVLQIGLPADAEEIYTLRVVAVDGDSLVSNQVTGQLRVLPDPSDDA